MKIEYLHKGIDAINLPGLLRSKLVTDKVQCISKKESHQFLTSTLTLLLAKFSVFRQPFQTWKLQIICQVQEVDSFRCPDIVINLMDIS